ncbi:glycosyltransferase family 2 protein [Stutzerimonas nitrititolerans]|uniref:glycosyltransferase family 2 protein n=1 Tax=Stutzerimonas nitrititolerans TaxID=2482751 RepID=UPI0014833778|nr:glycosyltransferase [Stutzerimonas nitrititolerans]NNT94906.1 glycosyltransferase [Stutzerimonas nitrititolerans]
MTPKVSVVMAVKNEEKYIGSAIQSVLNQDVLGVELIVVDDGSSDSTTDIVKAIALADDRVVLEFNASSGKVSAFKFGYALAKGEYIALFAGDDIMPPGSLAKRLLAIQGMLSPSVLMSKIQVLSEDKKIDGTLIPRQRGKGNPSGASIMFDREAAKCLMDIPEELPNEDTWMDFCLTYLPMLNVSSHDEVSCLWRVHSGNSITIKDEFQTFNKKFSLRMNVIDEFLRKYRGVLAAERLAYLEKLACAEDCRRKGKWIQILFMRINLSDKIRFLAYSNGFLYKLRKSIRAI